MTKLSELPHAPSLNTDDLVPILRPDGQGGFVNQITPFSAIQNAQPTVTGPAGASAYDIAVSQGFQGSSGGWLQSLRGPQGLSAYEQAVASNLFNGTFQQFMDSLAGDSAYEVAVANGFVGTAGDWLTSLKGLKGDKGDPGTPGLKGDKGEPGEVTGFDSSAYEKKGEANGRSTLIGDYTLGLLDKGMILESNSTSTITVTVPADVDANFVVNSVINLYRYGAGDLVITCDPDVSLFSTAGNRKLAQQHATAMLWKRGPNEWVLAGTLKA